MYIVSQLNFITCSFSFLANQKNGSTCKTRGPNTDEVPCRSGLQYHEKQNVLDPKNLPERVKDVKVVKGDWESVGSVRVWKYNAGVSESSTETIESVDDGNMTITFDALDGDIAKYNKTLKGIFSVTPNGQGSLAKWTLVYEKQNQNIPDPDHYAELASAISKSIDAYLLKQ